MAYHTLSALVLYSLRSRYTISSLAPNFSYSFAVSNDIRSKENIMSYFWCPHSTQLQWVCVITLPEMRTSDKSIDMVGYWGRTPHLWRLGIRRQESTHDMSWPLRRLWHSNGTEYWCFMSFPKSDYLFIFQVICGCVVRYKLRRSAFLSARHMSLYTYVVKHDILIGLRSEKLGGWHSQKIRREICVLTVQEVHDSSYNLILSGFRYSKSIIKLVRQSV